MNSSLKKIFIAVFLITFLVFLSIFNTNAKAYEISNDIKYYFSETEIKEFSSNENFSKDQILVVMETNYDTIYKTYEISDFPSIELLSIEELTIFSRGAILSKLNNKSMTMDEVEECISDFKTILLLKTKVQSREYILRCINILNSMENVIVAQPDCLYTAQANNKSVDYISEIDNYNNVLWNYNSESGINLEDAWDFTKGYNDVIVGVIDAGIFADHVDLVDIVNTQYCRDFSLSYPYIPTYVTDSDVYGHGTQVAGIIGSQNSNGSSFYGVAPNIQIASLKIQYYYHGQFASQLILAIDYAIEAKIPILNFSHGVDNFEGPINSIGVLEIKLQSYNGLLILSAGNNNLNIDNSSSSYPCNIDSPNVIIVGSYNIDSDKSNFSNYGENKVDIYAPGGEENNIFTDDIITTYGLGFLDLSSNVNGIYNYACGTSFAAPHVTGVAALILSLNANLTSCQIKDCILNGSDSILVYTQEGMQQVLKLNAFGAIKYALENYSNETCEISLQNTTYFSSKIILENQSYFDDKNGFYKIICDASTNYGLSIISNQDIEAYLYDQNFNEISYIDYGVGSNDINIKKWFNSGVYYLKTKFVDNYSCGIIDVGITMSEPSIVIEGNNNIIDTVTNDYDINTYIFVPDITGMYNISLCGTDNTGQITYNNETMAIYDNQYKLYSIKRLETNLYDLYSVSNVNCNNLVVYLQSGNTYYIDIKLFNNDIVSLYMNIDRINDMKEVDIGLINTYHIMTNETKLGDNFVQIDVVDNAMVEIAYDYNGTQSEYIYFVLYKEVYNTALHEYQLQLVFPDMMVTYGQSLTWYNPLTDGIYYIGYYNKLNPNSTISVTIVSNGYGN